jgi:hypothetical protein
MPTEAARYVSLSLRLSQEAPRTPVIDVIRAVRVAAVALAASRGDDVSADDVLDAARRRLGLPA